MAYAAPFPAASAAPRTAGRPVRSRPAATRSRVSRDQRSWHLTRRGRMVLGVVLSVPFAAALMVVGSVQADAETSANGAPATSVVVVQPGESLWGIAQQVAPGSDPREVITSIRELNGLSEAPVVPGQSLVVPAFDR